MDFADIYALRQALHNSPERSGEEKQTRKMLMEFLASHTALELDPCGEGFYAAHRERSGTFACASRGVTLSFQGQPAHAAYPGHGVSPAQAEVWLTLRAELDQDLEFLFGEILRYSSSLAEEYGLMFQHRVQDVFPAVVNHPDRARWVLDRCGGGLLDAPMRWSEDFGHYLRRCPGAFLGIGAGRAAHRCTPGITSIRMPCWSPRRRCFGRSFWGRRPGDHNSLRIK